MSDQHPSAVCRWCKGPFVKIFGWQWRCADDGCFDRCVKHAILFPEKPKDGSSPYFYLPLPLQVDIEEDPTKRLLVLGAVGVAKSYGARMSLYKRCRELPGYTALLLRCTLDQVTKNHLIFMDAEAKILGDCKFVNSYPKQMKFDNGSVMFAGYCDDEADIRQHMGIEFDEIVFEEASHFLPKALSEIATRDRGSATGRASLAKLGENQGRCRLPTNVGGRGFLFLRDHYIDRTPDPERYPHYDANFYGCIRGTIADNPYLAPNYASAVLGGLNAERYEQLASGRTDVFEGQFFGTFSEDSHVVSGDLS